MSRHRLPCLSLQLTPLSTPRLLLEVLLFFFFHSPAGMDTEPHPACLSECVGGAWEKN